VQPHLDVVAIGILPGSHLAADKRPRLVELHLVSCFNQIDCRHQPGQSGPNNGYPHSNTLKQALPGIPPRLCATAKKDELLSFWNKMRQGSLT